METLTNPLFYTSPVPVNSTTHAETTLGPSPSGLQFAASAQTVLLAVSEFFEARPVFPIIFSRTEDGRVVALALMGLETGENLLVDGEGRWQGTYIPAYIRRYPFITTDAQDGRLTVCLDESYDGLNQEGGTRLFEDGKPSARLEEIGAFLRTYLDDLRQTEQFGAALAQLGLLAPVNAQANMNDGRQFALTNLLVVDEQRMSQLPDTELAKLHRTGMMPYITAHLLSLRTFGRLMELKAQRACASEAAAAE